MRLKRLHRAFPQEWSGREHRCIFGTFEEELDNSCDEPPPATIVSFVPAVTSGGGESTKDPDIDFGVARVNMDPHEASHVFDEEGKVTMNIHHRVEHMNRAQFQEHLRDLFETHMSQQMKPAEEPDAVDTAEELLGGANAYGNFLQRVTDNIFSTGKFQRGTVNYFSMYTKVWGEYFKEAAHYKSIHINHPFYLSGAWRFKQAPGIYQNGELVDIPSTYDGRPPGARSKHAAAMIRDRAGITQDRTRDMMDEVAEEMQGYVRGWKNFHLRSHPGDDEGAAEYARGGLLKYLQSEGFKQKDITLYMAAAVDPLKLPAEATVVDPKDEETLTLGKVDLRDRHALAETILAATDRNDIKNTDQFNEQLALKEIEPMNIAMRIPQILHYVAAARMTRGKLDKPEMSGLVVVDRRTRKVTEAPEVLTISFGDVLNMVSDQWTKGFENAEYCLQDERAVFSELKNILKERGAIEAESFNVDLYTTLVAQCQNRSGDEIIPFALDELRGLIEHYKIAAPLGKKLEELFDKPESLQNHERWTEKQYFGLQKLMQSSEDRKALKPILAGHTELPLDLDEFKNLWNRLESVADSMGLFDMVLSSTAPEIVADPLKADIAESLYYEGVFAQGSGINQADRGTINPFDALRLSVARSDAELGRYIGLFVTSETQTLLGLGIEYLDIGKNYKIKVKDARKKWENKQPLLDTDLALLRLPVERYQYVLKKKEFKKLGAFGLDELLQKVNIQVLKNGQADLRNGSSEHAISHAQYAELMMLYARGYVKSNFADALSYKPWERIDSLLQEKKRVFNAVGEIHTCVVKSGSTVVEINAMLLRKKADLTPLYLDRLFVKDALKETQQYLQTNKINENFTYIGFQITSPEVLLCIYDPNKNPNSLNPRGSGDPARPAEYFHVLQDLRPE